nr:hypothetical protein [Tanacetum cinerariifolium]
MVAIASRSSFRSYDDQTQKVSRSIFVTNFPETVTSRDLWKTCGAYGTMVDVFIPFKKIQGRPHKPHSAHIAKFGDLNKSLRPSGSQQLDGNVGSYANLVKGVSLGVPGSLISPAPALVLDGSCLVDRDLSKHVMGKVKDFTSIPNMPTLLTDEGFSDIKFTYLGGLWVMFELAKAETKEHLMNHTGVKSWFHIVQDVVLNAWSRETFVKIGKIWGETLDLEDNSDSLFRRKRKVYMVRAKELFTWNPFFFTHKEREYSSEDESVHAPKNFPHFSDEDSDDENASDVNGVPETDFGTSIGERDKQHLDNPFEIYDLLKKKNCGKNYDSCPSLSHPSGFTPVVSEKRDDNATIIGDTDSKVVKEHSESLNAKVMNNSQEVSVEVNSESAGQSVIKNGGSLLGVLEGCIRVSQAMRYTIEGCAKDLENIIGNQGDDNVIR